MTPRTCRHRSRRGGRTAALAGAAALVAALTASGCSARADGATSPPPAADVTPASALAASVPDRIAIPDIHVDAPLGEVGLAADGTMQTPPFDRPKEADWYKEGPTPGEPGPATIVGHMDTAETPKAVFHDLARLKKGERIEVHRKDGADAVFAVDSVDTFKKDAFPTQKVYGATERPELRLITCGGSLTKDRHWDSNVVVFAHLTGKA
ncbi:MULTISPECIES: class F sortase [Streptomyces]|uniref:class F sortase n=1 Tax=Streptomyces TaxID=1883 RepID=UPI001F07923D|nr:class F sortase [Streptomyces sp. MBT27]